MQTGFLVHGLTTSPRFPEQLHQFKPNDLLSSVPLLPIQQVITTGTDSVPKLFSPASHRAGDDLEWPHSLLMLPTAFPIMIKPKPLQPPPAGAVKRLERRQTALISPRLDLPVAFLRAAAGGAALYRDMLAIRSWR